MTASDPRGVDTVREAFLNLKRQTTDLELHALLHDREPVGDIDDLDAAVAEVVAGVEQQRRARAARKPGAPIARPCDLSGSPRRQGSA
ncbi:hypothetical protein ACFXHA_43205 [Nocardia sp. NPDC059240]|uniref:hypothetical protein n=1 Tax=Nocardia sp. NPDC059240 TaxID=3346786 RepID=UPI00367DD394